MKTLQLVTRPSKPHCANKCGDATVVVLMATKDGKRRCIASWFCCSCSLVTPPASRDEAWEQFLASKSRRSKAKILQWIGEQTAKEGENKKPHPISIRSGWLLWLLVKSVAISVARKAIGFIRDQADHWLWQTLPAKDDQIRLAFVGDGVLQSAVQRTVARNDAMFAERGNYNKFVSAHHLARVGVRLGLADQLGLDPKNWGEVHRSLEQFDDCYMCWHSLRKISEVVEALIGQTYERFGYEAAAAFVEEQIVWPYLDAPFCAGGSSKSKKRLPATVAVAA